MTKFEKETRHKLYVFIKNQQSTQQNTINTTSRTHDAFCPLTWA